jgi:hypothetical protein
MEGRPYPWSQQVIQEISGLGFLVRKSALMSKPNGMSQKGKLVS